MPGHITGLLDVAVVVLSVKHVPSCPVALISSVSRTAKPVCTKVWMQIFSQLQLPFPIGPWWPTLAACTVIRGEKSGVGGWQITLQMAAHSVLSNIIFLFFLQLLTKNHINYSLFWSTNRAMRSLFHHHCSWQCSWLVLQGCSRNFRKCASGFSVWLWLGHRTECVAKVLPF